MSGGDYYRFEQERVLNLITSSHSNIVYDRTRKTALVAGLESVYQWNIRTGALVLPAAGGWGGPEVCVV